ncbi:hypothetical protein KUTeg_013903 [Tegillarca granosa]|uniref:NF-kappa-B inhibitor cactus n=1 Tax=Tegillarca granosa TaxID=220873 RepID=A0ABQ9EVF0_TEGGR|nr:hypothetical protein KUTeg_013903 [Tegillarca granosa]
MESRHITDLQEDGDLEVDSAPTAERFRSFPLKDLTHDKCDSGVDSYNSLLSSHDSGLKSEDRLPEPTVSDVGRTFQSLNIESKDNERLNSTDEGYCDSLNEKSEPVAEFEKPKQNNEVVQIFSQDNDGDSQLHMAIIQLLSTVALYFISKAPHFVWLNLKNDLQQTPLHLAVITRLKDVVRRLVVGGAFIDARDHKGDTPLHIASREGFDDIAVALLEPVKREEVKENHYEIPYQMIPQELEARNYEGQTCLHLAAEGSHLPVLELLLSKGANVNAQDGKSGRSALHYAAETGNMVLLEFLLMHPRINVNARTYGGFTPAMLAQGRGHQHVINRLVNAGAYEPETVDESDSEEEMESYDDFHIGGQRVYTS